MDTFLNSDLQLLWFSVVLMDIFILLFLCHRLKSPPLYHNLIFVPIATQYWWWHDLILGFLREEWVPNYFWLKSHFLQFPNTRITVLMLLNLSWCFDISKLATWYLLFLLMIILKGVKHFHQNIPWQSSGTHLNSELHINSCSFNKPFFIIPLLPSSVSNSD